MGSVSDRRIRRAHQSATMKLFLALATVLFAGIYVNGVHSASLHKKGYSRVSLVDDVEDTVLPRSLFEKLALLKGSSSSSLGHTSTGTSDDKQQIIVVVVQDNKKKRRRPSKPVVEEEVDEDEEEVEEEVVTTKPTKKRPVKWQIAESDEVEYEYVRPQKVKKTKIIQPVYVGTVETTGSSSTGSTTGSSWGSWITDKFGDKFANKFSKGSSTTGDDAEITYVVQKAPKKSHKYSSSTTTDDADTETTWSKYY